MPGSPSLPSFTTITTSIYFISATSSYFYSPPTKFLVLHRSRHSHDGTASRPLISLVGVIVNRLGVTATMWVNLATSFENNNLNRDDPAHSREFCLRSMHSLRPRNSPELHRVVRKPVAAMHLRLNDYRCGDAQLGILLSIPCRARNPIPPTCLANRMSRRQLLKTQDTFGLISMRYISRSGCGLRATPRIGSGAE